ncbi:hypothetical protein Nepgr_002211 [Nepenthes gracilis]|uniref:RRM domain-containing protein n=1 Tax=Nepenthes gracilis TaxID=150966 RepID=A0AAD3P6N6_NEPGR|nr:hypothetical protein Nepgr_002211 [Nepenthes gracilis]
MSQQQRQFQMVSGNHGGQFHDTTFTKIFVGGLAWETQRDTMKSYFEQFGEILEAVVITDKSTGRSKGYGFVTFKDPQSAFRACQNASPVIDGRRANCNLAFLGAQKTKPPIPRHGTGRFRAPAPGLVAQLAYPAPSSSTYFHQPSAQIPFPYSAYGFNTSGYSHEAIYPMNYYGVYGGQHFTTYYTAGGSGAPSYFPNFLQYYNTPYAQSSSQVHGYGLHYPEMVQYPYLPHPFSSTRIVSLPSPLPPLPSISTGVITAAAGVAGSGSGPPQATVAASEQNSST